MHKTILQTEALSVGYDGKPVVAGIDLTAQTGRIVTLIGPNGAGKSTILKTLIRQLEPVGGAVYLNRTALSRLGTRELAQTVSAVLTGRPEPELMTCRDVVSSGRHPYTGRLGILSAADRERVAEAMSLVGVADLAQRDFNRLSDGQRQRVLLARAICQEPKLLVLDEPTSFLDIRHKLEFLGLLRRLTRERALAVLLSLHELDLAQKCSDLILCVKDGAIDRTGTPEEIFTGGYIEALYGVERGRYNPLFGCVELASDPATCTAPPWVFVVGGGGSGIPVYRRLQRMGIPFAAGVLPENDLDLPVAEALAAVVIREKPFEPVSEAAVERALEIAAQCQHLICCTETFGPMNRNNQALRDFAAEQSILLPPHALDQLE